MKYGFVYVLGNPSMPGIYKIGHTCKHPKERMEELSRATACPTPFTLLAYFGCEDPQQTEFEIHEQFKDYRVNRSREFFRAPAAMILDVIRGYADEALHDEPLDIERWHDEQDARVQFLYDLFFSQDADPYQWRSRGFE